MPDPLSSVVGVRFRNAGKIGYFHSGGMRLEPGEYVVVESTRGPEIGRVVIAPGQVVVNELGDDLPPILRLATEDDIHKADGLGQEAERLLPKARALAAEIGFPGHIEKLEFALDRRRLVASFSSEDRIEYRDFVRLASERFGVRVEARQLGARDRARLAGGYGICGRELCCSNWLSTFPSISIRMAKEQDLPLNPQKISGLCGRLLCCLSYEEEGYKEMRRTLPRVGQRCSTPTGEGKVIGVNTLQRQVTLLVNGQRIEVGDRDLGTVVRWDPSSRAAEPPPSLTRQEAIAAGIIEDTGEDLSEAEEPTDLYDPGAGRGRLPAGGPRRVVRPPRTAPPAPGRAPAPTQESPEEARSRRGRRPRGGGGTRPADAPSLPPASPGPPGARTRSFQRAPSPMPLRPDGIQPPEQRGQDVGTGAGEEPGAAGGRRRRRGGRGRRGAGGQGPTAGQA